ncbi:hypothetical protein EMCRGX_G021608 [Ephydatia muelleri]
MIEAATKNISSHCQSYRCNGDVDLSIHVSLLKKFKSAVRGMDYKTLMTGEDSVSVLRPALLATNVHLIAKLAAKIPCKACDNGFLSSEVVFRVFAEKLFMTGDGKQTEPQDKLPLSTRIELLGRLLKLWRRALNGASSAEVTGSSEEGHNSIAMEMALEHLRSVHTAALKRPQECSDKVYAVCSKMVASGLRLDVVGTVLDVTHKVQPHTMSVLSLVQEALSHALEELRHTDSEPQDVLCKIETVISSVRQHEQESGRLVSSGQVLAIIRPHCSDSSHTVDTRRALLHIIDKHLTLSEDDLNLLILYQTQAILLNQFAVEVKPHRAQDWSELPVVRQHCLIPMDAHLNLGKFLYEETPAWKKYHGSYSKPSHFKHSTNTKLSTNIFNNTDLRPTIDIQRGTGRKPINQSPEYFVTKNGVDLLKVRGTNVVKYALGLLDALYTEEELKQSSFVPVGKSTTSVKPPLSPERMKLFEDCLKQKFSASELKENVEAIRQSCTQKCRDKGRKK